MSQTYDAGDRARVRRLAPLGPAEISRQTGIPLNTVSRWLDPPARRRSAAPSRSIPELADASGERLGSARVGASTHAAYPSASFALCGVRLNGATRDPCGPAPDCVECAETAAVFDRIDGSAPSEWQR